MITVAGNIHIGTSGWHYKSWKESFYPGTLATKHWLSFYAEIFSTTEINNCFYRLPSRETIEGWMEQTPEDFRFSPKFSRYLTQFKKLNDPEEPFERFFDLFKIMKRKLGVVLLQLPPNLGFKEKTVASLFHLIKSRYADYRFAVEVRHPSWLCANAFRLLSDHNIALVISQQGVGWPYVEELTASHIYMRFHGPTRLFASGYNSAQLEEFARKMRGWKKRGFDIWAYFNNDVYTDAVFNARELQNLTA